MFTHDFIVIGGGAAGFFAALHAEGSVALLEKTAVLLSKVKISGGGRCNVTHACFDPKELIKNYPRGGKELLGPFHRFQPRDTIEWFESRGVQLKTEDDGRMFPVTDSSETIIQCLLNEAKKRGVDIQLRQRILQITKDADGFTIERKDLPPLRCRRLLLATGSSPEGFAWAESFGHTIQKPVPSLFTFNIPTSPLKDLSGIVIDPVVVTVGEFSQRGPLLITHFGFSGPAVLKLSAWAARLFAEKNYNIDITVNWLPDLSEDQIFDTLKFASQKPFPFPQNFWKAFAPLTSLHQTSHKVLRELSHRLHADTYHVEGKTTHKEEFVTCGGVTLKEVNFKTMESKLCPGLYFAGEILDIDGVTGGFNFQNAWTTGYIAGSAISEDQSRIH
ncbi:MAG: NAD(P)/FAD-dependent oxidoreductase [Verrucomicrobia bacterium]|nr:NAD(P)/FAD-dependent oxidoreductase [Verrucomicrobiota bacterium]